MIPSPAATVAASAGYHLHTDTPPRPQPQKRGSRIADPHTTPPPPSLPPAQAGRGQWHTSIVVTKSKEATICSLFGSTTVTTTRTSILSHDGTTWHPHHGTPTMAPDPGTLTYPAPHASPPPGRE
ncbi:hypothetical protein E2C01_100624 [Portunus trituberculatus]|uniref:Uncharacterized protein n=1 Tax=Portunus trituberculatus TaxID=210409 RepID=A0A5B7K7E1_PORTR|nr:hypothetical protein [Portunus trituberculatus]